MRNIPQDSTVHVGMHLFDGTDYDTIIERIEYGGFGIIAFGANRLNDGRMIAYKTLRRDLLDDPRTRASFVRECLLWVGLWTHPNVTKAFAVSEMGDTEGLRPFLALEYAEHGSLRGLLRVVSQQSAGGRLPFDIALGLAQQIAAGLAYLHQPDPAYFRNDPTVHRDLKPENVLLLEDGRVVITDFGLAKAVESSPTALALLLGQSSRYDQGTQPGRQAEEAILLGGEEATHTTSLHTAQGVALGTIPYMAPEQWEDARYAGTPADIYALGIMLSEIFAGRHALLDLEQAHAQAEWRRAHANPRPRPLRDVVPEIPPIIEAIYRRCLAADPDDRPTAGEVLAALQEGARAAGEDVYTPEEIAPHSQYNEWGYWHNWSVAYLNFDLLDEALARNDRAIGLAQQFKSDRPNLYADTLLTRGNILQELGEIALSAGNRAELARLDQQVEAVYLEAQSAYPPATEPQGRLSRSFVWNQVGIFNKRRSRYAHAEDAFRRAIALKPDKTETYYNRALNQAQWGLAEAAAGNLTSAVEHLHQARVHAVTALGLGDPTAQRLLEGIEVALHEYGAV